MYIGVTLLRWPEPAVWKMTPYKIITLFTIHKEFNPDRFKDDPPKAQGMLDEDGFDDIDVALGGL